MDLARIFAILWRRKWIIIVTPLISTLVVLIGIQFFTPKYEASVTLRVPTSRSGQVTYEDLLYADRLLKTYAQIASGPALAEELASTYSLSYIPNIKAEVVPNSELLVLTVEYDDPAIARDAANGLANLAIRQGQEVDMKNNLVVVEQAVLPREPVIPPFIIIGLGLAIGLAGGVGLAFLFENLDNRIYPGEQAELIPGLATVGKIPKVLKRQSLIVRNKSPYHFIEAFHILRANISMQNHRRVVKTLLITSANPEDGKSTVTANLAMAIHDAGKKVLIVDADIRKPRLHQIFRLPNEVGFSNVLNEELEPIQAIQEIDKTGIWAMTSGPLPTDPTSLLGSKRLNTLIEKLSNKFDFILFDSPCLLAVPDAKLLAKHLDGLLLVVNCTKTSKTAIDEIRSDLAEYSSKMVGIVQNQARLQNSYYHYQKERKSPK